MIGNDENDDTLVGDVTVVNFNDQRRVRGAGRPRLDTRKWSSIAQAVAGSAGTKGGQWLEDIARALAAAQAQEFVKSARKSRGYSQGELAELVGVTQARISQWENMERSGETIDIVNLFKIAEVCQFPLILSWNEKASKKTASPRKGRPIHEYRERRPRK